MKLLLFCRDPNGAVPNASASEAKNSEKGHEELNTPYWDTYDTINQFYLELGRIAQHIKNLLQTLWRPL